MFVRLDAVAVRSYKGSMDTEPASCSTLPALLRAQMAVAFPRASLADVVTLTSLPYSKGSLHAYVSGATRPRMATLRDLLGRLKAPADVVDRAVHLWTEAECAETGRRP